MFEPMTILGMMVGLAIIAGSVFLLVRGHLARERHEAEQAERRDRSDIS